MYLLSFLTGLVLSAFSFVSTIALLSAVERLPAPPLSGTYCIDEKLAWLRAHPEAFASNFVAVGSSVTWRNLDFSVLSPAAYSASGGTVNAAPCFLRANQTRFMVEYLLRRRPEIHTIMIVLSPRDMEVCSTTPAAFFEPELANSYFSGQTSDWWLYFRNFRPKSFIEDALNIPRRRQKELVFDQFGSGPITTDEPALWYPFTPDPSCYRELKALAHDLQEKRIQFIVATFPVMPAWAAHYDSLAATRTNFLRDLQSALSGTDTFLIDAQTHYPLPTSAFTDPAHLQWPHVADFTRYVWSEARRAGAKLPSYDLNNVE